MVRTGRKDMILYMVATNKCGSFEEGKVPGQQISAFETGNNLYFRKASIEKNGLFYHTFLKFIRYFHRVFLLTEVSMRIR